MYLKNNPPRHPGQIPDVSETLLKSVFFGRGERKSTKLKLKDASIFTVTFLTNFQIIGFTPESSILFNLNLIYVYGKKLQPVWFPRTPKICLAILVYPTHNSSRYSQQILDVPKIHSFGTGGQKLILNIEIRRYTQCSVHSMLQLHFCT